MNNLPPGAENDPNAPWNQKDPVMIECDDCDGVGSMSWFEDEILVAGECKKCDGSGEIESTDEEL